MAATFFHSWLQFLVNMHIHVHLILLPSHFYMGIVRLLLLLLPFQSTDNFKFEGYVRSSLVRIKSKTFKSNKNEMLSKVRVLIGAYIHELSWVELKDATPIPLLSPWCTSLHSTKWPKQFQDLLGTAAPPISFNRLYSRSYVLPITMLWR